MLTPPEREVLAGYAFPKRRHDWLLGRLAAKRALRIASGDAGGDAWALDAIAVLAGPQNRPGFRGPDERLAGHDLTITHGHGHAGAVAAPGAVGLDMERVRGVAPNGWKFFLSEAERAWLAGEPLGPDGEIVFWAVKEAAFKALHGAVESLPRLAARIGPGTAVVTHETGTLAARWRLADGFCVAVAAPDPAPAWLDAVGLEVPTAP